jgi:aminoglycoside phosphotransferase
VPARESDPSQLEQLLGEPVAHATRAVWGFQNRTDMVTLTTGDRVVVQRYRRRADADHRLRVMESLRAPAAAVGIAVPHVRDSGVDADPSWIAFDALPGVPIPEAGDAAPGGARFPAMARLMGELLAAFRELAPVPLPVDDLWSDPERLAVRGVGWGAALPDLDAVERAALDRLLDRFAWMFAGRRVVLAHGDFAPVNVLTDGSSLTGLLDFESVRFADALFDVAWWEWSVSFSSPAVLESARAAFLEGAGIDATEDELDSRVRALQVLRMLELLSGDSLGPGIRRIVIDRLRATIRDADHAARRLQR